jgi:tRNA G46 methylase TrmB
MDNGIYSYKSYSSSADIDFIYRNEKEKLQYENFSLREIETQIWINGFEENGVFLDIGANIGLFSLQAAITNPKLKVISIEPHIPCFETLFQNIMLNKCENVMPVNMAFSHANQVDTFNYMRTQSGTAKSVFGRSIDYQGKEFKPDFVFLH